MSRPKKHHIVPQLLLRNFTDEAGKFYIYNKFEPKPVIRQSIPKNEFIFNQFYSTYDSAGNRDASFEQFQGEYIEGSAGPVIKKLVERNDYTLNTQEKDFFYNFILNLWQRSPDSNLNVNSIPSGYEDAIIEASKQAPFHVPDEHIKKMLYDPRTKAEMIQRIKVNVLQIKPEGPLNFLATKGMCISKIKKSNKSFIVGSSIFAREANINGDTDLRISGVKLWLPLSPKIAYTPLGMLDEISIIEPTNLQIRLINQQIYNNSRIVASASKRLLESLINSR